MRRLRPPPNRPVGLKTPAPTTGPTAPAPSAARSSSTSPASSAAPRKAAATSSPARISTERRRPSSPGSRSAEPEIAFRRIENQDLTPIAPAGPPVTDTSADAPAQPSGSLSLPVPVRGHRAPPPPEIAAIPERKLLPNEGITMTLLMNRRRHRLQPLLPKRFSLGHRILLSSARRTM
jgi:hypothetical protein